ncbi:ANTAR domain-containing protein [Streptomyces sp. PvR034]|uniref:ANTAR domain-containing protein n=1 Tax=Streptomyces sp. PvR034 TaxID=3156401 RepID=UPI003394E2DE
MSAEAARRGGEPAVLDACTAAVAALPVSGAAVTAMTRGGDHHPVCGTDRISERLEELQLTLGEGPCLDAFALGAAVLMPDLRASEPGARWPVFTDGALAAGAGAVFAFPLQIGAIGPGVMDLYCSRPVELDPGQLSDAMAFADTAALLLLDSRTTTPDATATADRGGWLEAPGGYRAEIDQATGMLTVQLGVGIEEAFLRLRAHAYAHGLRLTTVAADVVSRRLRFHPDAEPTTQES